MDYNIVSISKILFVSKANAEFVSHGISNLLLQNKKVRASALKILNSFGKMGGNQWDALRAFHFLALKKPLCSVLVPLCDYPSAEEFAVLSVKHH